MWRTFRDSGTGKQGVNDSDREYFFNRQKLRCLSCNKEQYPLDEALGIPCRRLVTSGLRERALWLATEMAYDRASLGMRKLCDISISDETIKNLVVEEGSEVIKQKELVGELLGLAGRGATKELLSRLGRLRLHSREPTFRAKLDELINYIINNRDGIENATKVDFYGSGPVEKAVDITICRRFKKRGMSWYVHKANPLLALKLLKLNGELESYWRQKGLVTV